MRLLSNFFYRRVRRGSRERGEIFMILILTDLILATIMPISYALTIGFFLPQSTQRKQREGRDFHDSDFN
ncbi:MAG: hypothetical protein EAZ78_19485 [Oscillatoriales cyanobacterium]|nr:MAG: hypothetical protein EAZ78_19485 [Oscillatoriales cyanobacterium]TAF70867.1 MAG: hypothetical protein EAZ59_03110 [Oscillatoriales cyanobacterium]